MILIQHYRDSPVRAQALFSQETSFCNIKKLQPGEGGGNYTYDIDHIVETPN